MQVPTSEVANAAKQVGRFRSIAARFAQGVGHVTKAVAGPLLAALQFVDAIELITMTETGVKGAGFTFRNQLAEAHAMAKDVAAMTKEYTDSGYHQQLDELVTTAKQNDEKYSQYAVTPPQYWGTEELSDFCIGAYGNVSKHKDMCAELLEHLRRAYQEVTLRYEYCNKLLSNPTAMVALSFPTSVPASRVLMAWLDLDKIAETLRPTQAALAKHVRIVEQDRQALHDNILEAGLAGVW